VYLVRQKQDDGSHLFVDAPFVHYIRELHAYLGVESCIFVRIDF
jgi:hypothetical protein